MTQEEASVENAKLNLSKVRIESPITGIITRRNIEEGETVVIGTMNTADRSIALLTVPGQRGPDEQMAVVRDPSLVSWLVMSFEQLWADSMPLEAPASATRQDVQLAHTQAAILRMLAEGEKDEAISRRLSISVRTCRRHIADYMAQVGASSRFQAGVIAATAGYLTSPF